MANGGLRPQAPCTCAAQDSALPAQGAARPVPGAHNKAWMPLARAVPPRVPSPSAAAKIYLLLRYFPASGWRLGWVSSASHASQQGPKHDCCREEPPAPQAGPSNHRRTTWRARLSCWSCWPSRRWRRQSGAAARRARRSCAPPGRAQTARHTPVAALATEPALRHSRLLHALSSSAPCPLTPPAQALLTWPVASSRVSTDTSSLSDARDVSIALLSTLTSKGMACTARRAAAHTLCAKPSFAGRVSIVTGVREVAPCTPRAPLPA